MRIIKYSDSVLDNGTIYTHTETQIQPQKYNPRRVITNQAVLFLLGTQPRVIQRGRMQDAIF